MVLRLVPAGSVPSAQPSRKRRLDADLGPHDTVKGPRVADALVDLFIAGSVPGRAGVEPQCRSMFSRGPAWHATSIVLSLASSVA